MARSKAVPPAASIIIAEATRISNNMHADEFMAETNMGLMLKYKFDGFPGLKGQFDLEVV